MLFTNIGIDYDDANFALQSTGQHLRLQGIKNHVNDIVPQCSRLYTRGCKIQQLIPIMYDCIVVISVAVISLG